MKKIFALFMAVIAASLLFVGCSKESDGRRVFTVGFDADFPPYGFVGEDGQYKGFDLDLAAEVCKRMGWKLKLKAIDWAAKDAELNAGTIDCIWNGFTITPEREKMYTWSKPYVLNAQNILVKRDSDIMKFEDLNGKTVVTQDGSSGDEALAAKVAKTIEMYPDFALKEIKKVPDYLTAKSMLESGAADAIALDSAVAQGFVTKGDGNYKILAEPLSTESYGIGFKLGNTMLCGDVERTLCAIVYDGTAAKIVKYWAENEAEHGGDKIDFIYAP